MALPGPLSLQFGDFAGVERHRAALPRHRVQRWMAAMRWTSTRRDRGAHRRRDEGQR
jgi:hypothetical protein